MIDRIFFKIAVVFFAFIFFVFLVSLPPLQAETKKDLYGDALPLHAETRLGTLRFRSWYSIWAIAISPDGKMVATGSCPGSVDNQVVLWNAGNGKKICTLFGNWNQPKNIISLAWSPDGRKLAVSYNYVIEIWDVVERKRIGTLESKKTGKKELYWIVKWSSDGKHIVAIKKTTNQLFIWDAANRRLLNDLTFSHDLHDFSLSDDGKRIVLCGQKLLKVFDASSGNEILDVPGIEDTVDCVDISPNDERIAGGCTTKDKKHCIRLWDAKTGRLGTYPAITTAAVEQLAFDNQGDWLIMKGGEYLWFWDLAAGQCIKEIHSCCLGRVLSISQDRKTLASGDRRIALWNVASGNRIHFGDAHDIWVKSVFFVDAQTILSSGQDGIRYWRYPTGEQIQLVPDSETYDLGTAFSTDGLTMATLSAAGEIILRNVKDGKIKLDLAGENHKLTVPYYSALTLSPDGTEIVSGDKDQEICFWNLRQRRLIRKIPPLKKTSLFPGIIYLQFSPDGKLLICGIWDQDLALLDVKKGEIAATIPNSHAYDIPTFDFNPKNSQLVIPSIDSKIPERDKQGNLVEKRSFIRSIDYLTHKEKWRSALMSPPTCIAVSADGKLVAASEFWSNVIHLLSAETGKELMKMPSTQDTIRCMAFSPDNRHLATGAQDTTILVWELSEAWKNLEKTSPSE